MMLHRASRVHDLSSPKEEKISSCAYNLQQDKIDKMEHTEHADM